MSRLAPDIPELRQVPEAGRSLVYLGALSRAIRLPVTWLMGAPVFAAAVGIGVTQGRALFGGAGAVVGAAVPTSDRENRCALRIRSRCAVFAANS